MAILSNILLFSTTIGFFVGITNFFCVFLRSMPFLNNVHFVLFSLFCYNKCTFQNLPLKKIIYIKYVNFDCLIEIWQSCASNANMDIIPYAKPWICNKTTTNRFKEFGNTIRID